MKLLLCIMMVFSFTPVVVCYEESSSHLKSNPNQNWQEELDNEASKTCKKPCPLCMDEIFLFSVKRDLPNHIMDLGTVTQPVSHTPGITVSAGDDLNVTGATSDGEFKCRFHWNEKKLQELKEDILDRINNRQKSFIRFTVPVIGYTNKDLPMHEEKRLLTWVWVFTKYDYMLHYPHNFIKISLATMGIITEDWALDYNNSIVPVSLRNFSFDIDDDYYEYEANVGQCDRECIEAYNSCGIGRRELVELINVIEPEMSAEWEWVCLQLPYSEHITDVTGSQPSFVTPNVVYYVMFLWKLVSERPLLRNKRAFIQYQCYKGKDLSVSKRKEVLNNYFVIPFIAFVLWLYAPLLIHYFPSSSEKSTRITITNTPSGMFPSHKSPNYLGRCLKSLFCFYAPKNSARSWICCRRLLFLSLIWLSSSFRVFFIPYYGKFAFVIVVVLTLAMLYPFYISKHIMPDVKFTFMGWEVPSHLVSINPDIVEYQLLASIMQERACILLDPRFLSFVRQNILTTFANYSWIASNPLYTAFKCTLKPLHFLLLLILNILWYAVPLPFFTIQLLVAVLRMTRTTYQQSPSITNKVFCVIQGSLMYCTFSCCLVVILFWCYAIMEVSLFTLMGGTMLPTMAFPYFVLVGSVASAVYSLVHALHEDYETIISNTISILDSERKIPSKRVFDPSRDEVVELVKEEDTVVPSSYSISVISGKNKKKHELMRSSVVVTFLSTKLYESVVEACHPLRRQIPFMVLQVIAMLFYAIIVMWTKNVYHLEPEVDEIFSLVTTVSVTFVPRLLRYLAYKSYFGQNTAIALKQNVYFAIIDYITIGI